MACPLRRMHSGRAGQEIKSSQVVRLSKSIAIFSLMREPDQAVRMG